MFCVSLLVLSVRRRSHRCHLRYPRMPYCHDLHDSRIHPLPLLLPPAPTLRWTPNTYLSCLPLVLTS